MKARARQSLFPVAVLATALLVNAPAFGFVCIESGSGNCLHWADGSVFLKSFLGAPSRQLINGTFTWDQNAIDAANDWNSIGAIRFDVAVGGEFNNPCGPPGPGHRCSNTGPAGDNPVFFTSSFCGQGFGDIIELTNNCWNPATGEIFNAPVFVNNTVPWNAYDGPLRSSGNGETVYDIRRVLVHEFGHVLGLDHPDERGQNVVALMNSRVSGLDRLQTDDINGARSIYGGSPPPPSGDSSGSSGCAIGGMRAAGGRGAGVWGLLLPALLLRAARRTAARRTAARRARA